MCKPTTGCFRSKIALKAKTAKKWKTMKNAPKEQNKDEKLLIMSKVVVFRQDCSRINSRFFNVGLNITVF